MEVLDPKIIGVDEFAFRRGGIYGTLIVDLERHRPIAVLDSDQAEPFSEWLLVRPKSKSLRGPMRPVSKAFIS
jgi:transposase